MIRGIGIDLVDTARMERWLENESLLNRYFSPQEISYVLNKNSGAAASLAARFAAKEAFGKALGCGLMGMKLKDIEVQLDPTGRPFLNLGVSALKAMREHGKCRVHLSLAHEKNMAIAQVIIEE